MFALLLALSTEVKYVYADENGREFVYEYVEEEAKPQYVYADESGTKLLELNTFMKMKKAKNSFMSMLRMKQITALNH